MPIHVTKKPKGLIYGQIGKKREQWTPEEIEERRYKNHLKTLKTSGWKARKIEDIVQSIDDKFYGKLSKSNIKNKE